MEKQVATNTPVRSLRLSKKAYRQTGQTSSALENSIYQSLKVEGYDVSRNLIKSRSQAVLGKSS
jgi:hypothetical protein